MKLKRLFQTIRLWTIPGDAGRAEWCKKQHIFHSMGDKVRIMDRKIPLYANLISFHNNIQVASNVSFITHDAIYSVLRGCKKFTGGGYCDHLIDKETECIQPNKYQEHIGCIEIMDNVFIGSNTTILGGVRIGPNAVVAAGSLVNRDVPPGTVVGGVPARVIGDFESLRKKNLIEKYPDAIRPIGQIVSKELEDYMWSEFLKQKEAVGER